MKQTRRPKPILAWAMLDGDGEVVKDFGAPVIFKSKREACVYGYTKGKPMRVRISFV